MVVLNGSRKKMFVRLGVQLFILSLLVFVTEHMAMAFDGPWSTEDDLIDIMVKIAKGARIIAIVLLGGIGSFIFVEIAHQDERQGKEKLNGLILAAVGLAIIWALIQWFISTSGTTIHDISMLIPRIGSLV